MNVRETLRRIVRWGGAVISLLLLALWIGSVWWNPAIMLAHRAQVMMRAGRLHVRWFDSRGVWDGDTISISGPGMIVILLDAERFRWWMQYRSDSFGTLVSVPLWLPAAAAMLLTVTAWKPELVARRRAGLGRCPKCNYDRLGLPHGAVCPECGMCN